MISQMKGGMLDIKGILKSEINIRLHTVETFSVYNKLKLCDKEKRYGYYFDCRR